MNSKDGVTPTSDFERRKVTLKGGKALRYIKMQKSLPDTLVIHLFTSGLSLEIGN